MTGIKLTEQEKSALRSIGKKAYAEMVRTVGGKKKLAAIARKQGHHGIKGGRPVQYPECASLIPYGKNKGKPRGRHRFKNGVCSCGQKQKIWPV